MNTVLKTILLLIALALPGVSAGELPPLTEVRLVTRPSDSAVVLHAEPRRAAGLSGYIFYKQNSPDSVPVQLNKEPLFSVVDPRASNGVSNLYIAESVDRSGQSVPLRGTNSATAMPFADEHAFLACVQRASFDYFWYEANPENGLIRDRSRSSSPCSIAAVGFGLTALAVGVDHEWVTRAAALDRATRTLNTLRHTATGTNASGTIGYKGWFYHFIGMESGTRSWQSELSSVDSAILFAGIIQVREFFDRNETGEAHLRQLANEILGAVDWRWMTDNSASLTHGWHPESGFIPHRWIGYSEASLLYLIGLGAERDGLQVEHWKTWTSGYQWEEHHGQAFVTFPPLFGHQYSHCWIDFRDIADDYMAAKGITYFENSRRATLAHRQSSQAENLWGITASDGPGTPGYFGYIARGAAPAMNDDGTIAPTAAGGSMPFAPEVCSAALRFMYDKFREQVWTPYGFCDAINVRANWFAPDVVAIDQGPILIMIENHLNGRVWKNFMKSPEIQRGLKAAGFRPLQLEKKTAS